MDLELSVTICSWNTLAETKACLESLEACRSEAGFEVIVIDNGSSDGSPDMIETEFPWVRLVRSKVNRGFAGGHNDCIKMRKAKDALLLNSDTVVHPLALRKLIDFARAHPNLGLLGPKLLNTDGTLQPSCRRWPNPVAALFRNTLLGKLFPGNKSTLDYLMTGFDHNSVAEVDWLSGAALYATERCIDEVGVFDEAYFMYCEDVDWCYRAHQQNLNVTYFPEAVITHAIGTSSSKAVNKMIVRFHRSMFRFYRLHMAPRTIIFREIALLFAGMGLALRASGFIARNGFTALFRKVAKPTPRGAL